MSAAKTLIRFLNVSSVLALAVAVSLSVSHADEYRLGPADRIRVRVADWQSAQASVRAWTAIDGEYTIGSNGAVSLPLIGETRAEGKTPAEIADAITGVMQDKFALLERPSASVEVAQYRPFYILGDVQNAGEFPYAPGLTVIRALSIAGGARNSLADGPNAERDLLNANYNHDLAVEERDRLLARRARLVAETAGKAEIDVSDDLQRSAIPAKLLADEQEILTANNARLTLQINGLDNLRELLRKEIASLESKVTSQKHQVELAKKEYAGIGTLEQKGLVANTRVLSAGRAISDLEGRLLDLGTASLRAKQSIAEADQQEINLRNDRAATLATASQTIDAELRDVLLKVEYYRALIGGSAPGTADGGPRLSFLIITGEGENATSRSAQENTAVAPGDVIKVERVVEEMGQ